MSNETLVQKVEDFAKEVGEDAHEVFDAFVNFVRGKKAEADANCSAEKNEANSGTETGTEKDTSEAEGATPKAADAEPQANATTESGAESKTA